MNVLVTGAAGYIGGHLVQRLLADGHKVIGLVHKFKPSDSSHKRLHYIFADISDYETVKQAVADVDFTAVFHCAARVRDYGLWHEFYPVNVAGTQHLLRLCTQRDVNRFVYLGHIPTSHGADGYSRSKKMAERLVLREQQDSGMPVVIIRPGNVFGPGHSVWVLRLFKAIKKHHVALIDHGQGIFLHTYIDNLGDTLAATLKYSGCVGEIITVTDGDNNTTWEQYLNQLSMWAIGKQISRTISYPMAYFVSRWSMLQFYVLGKKPVLTPLAVDLLTRKNGVSIKQAEELLDYAPRISYSESMKRIEAWLKSQGYI